MKVRVTKKGKGMKFKTYSSSRTACGRASVETYDNRRILLTGLSLDGQSCEGDERDCFQEQLHRLDLVGVMEQ